MAEHVDLTDPELHEPKGASTATVGQVFNADGAGSGSWGKVYTHGWENFDDTGTVSSPIALTLADTQYVLTNDNLGPASDSSFNIPTFSSLWNTGTNRFDFTSLQVGDCVTVRFDLEITTGGANHDLILEFNIAEGGTPFTLPIGSASIKSATTARVIRSFEFFIGSANVRDNPASVTLKSDSTGDEVLVHGWYTRVDPINPIFA